MTLLNDTIRRLGDEVARLVDERNELRRKVEWWENFHLGVVPPVPFEPYEDVRVGERFRVIKLEPHAEVFGASDYMVWGQLALDRWYLDRLPLEEVVQLTTERMVRKMRAFLDENDVPPRKS